MRTRYLEHGPAWAGASAAVPTVRSVPTGNPVANIVRHKGEDEYVVIGRDPKTGLAIRLYDRVRSRHVLIVGPTGVGKSTVVEHLAVGDMRAGRGLILFDTSGDLYRRILYLVPPHRWRDVVLLDYSDAAHPIARNFFSGVRPDDFIGRSILASAFANSVEQRHGEQSANPSLGPVSREFLQIAGYTLSCIPGATLITLLRLVEDAGYRERALTYVPNPVVRQWWQAFGKRPERGARSKEDLIASSLNKLRPYLTNDVLLAVMGQRQARFSWATALARQQIVLVRVPEYFERPMVELVFALEFALLSSAIFQRLRSRHRPPVSVILDDVLSPGFSGHSADDNHAATSVTNASRTAAGVRWPWRPINHSRL